MQKIFKQTNVFDIRACEKFFLSEEILMENAARGMAEFIYKKFSLNSKIIILCGSGNNGADGYALARILKGDFDVSIFCVSKPKGKLAQLQEKRAKAVGVKFITKLTDSDIFVDAIFGSGQRVEVSEEIEKILLHVNKKNGYKIACDIPTGIYSKTPFKADITFSMGALKEVLFHDFAKDFVGKIKCLNLGLARSSFEFGANIFLLEKKDLSLPIRKNKNTNKGDFGYLSIIKGEQKGASVISALAAFKMGVGLVGLVGNSSEKIPPSIMQTRDISSKTTALLAGIGLGKTKLNFEEFYNLPCVLDADLLYMQELKNIISNNKNVILTPHPKEFVGLYKTFCSKDISIKEVQKNRFEFAREFSLACKCVLVLKGANTIIANNGILYVCTFGTQALAKGGSGDVLAGFIASLLAQGREPLDASINGVLAHALISKKYKANNYSLTPQDLIEGIKWL